VRAESVFYFYEISFASTADLLLPYTSPPPCLYDAWTCPSLMDTPKSARVRATGVNSGEGTEAEAADLLSGVQG
jgi:hypothetical protein